MVLQIFSSVNHSIIALLSAFFGAIANILARTLLSKFKSRDILGINFLIFSATLVVFSPFYYTFNISVLSIFLLIEIVLIDLCANYFYFKSFEKSEASIVTPLLSLSPGFAFVFSWLIIGEKISLSQLFIAISIIVLVIFFTSDFKSGHKISKKSILCCILSSLLFGLSSIPTKTLLTKLAVTNPYTLYMLRSTLIGIIALMFISRTRKRITMKHYKIIFVRGLFVIAQWILLYSALSTGSIGVSLTLANITPIFVFILGAIFLKEKPTIKKALTAILVLVLSISL